jgi:hypothetical protein
MVRNSLRVFAALALILLPVVAGAQTRTTGQIVGTVKDVTGAVVPNAVLVLIDTGTGNTVEGKSGPEGGFVFPNLQPGTYTLTATVQGFQPVTLQSITVLTSRSTDITVQFQLAGVSEQVQVEGRATVVETTSTTVANTVQNAEIAKLPMAGRNILSFALLVPGAQQSTGARDSEYNGLPGGAINITLDGVNNNSARFRSGGTSFFTFAPIRLGAIEEVTVQTAGLTSEAGAEGAIQVQFATKRGSNTFRGQFFDTIQHESLNAQGVVNKTRRLPKTKLRQHEYGGNVGGPILRNKLFFFANYEQVYSPSENTQSRNILTPEAQQGIFRYTATDGSIRTVNLLDLARANGLPSSIDPFIQSQIQTINASLGQGDVASTTTLYQNTFRFINEQIPNVNLYPTARVDYQAAPSLAIRGTLNLHYRDLPTNPNFPGLDRVNGGFTSTYYIIGTGADWTVRNNLFNQTVFGVQSNYEEFNPGITPDVYTGPGGLIVNFPLNLSSPVPTGNVLPIPRNNPVYNLSNTTTWLKGRHTVTFGGTFRRTTMYESIGGQPPSYTLGIGTGDPAANIISVANISGLRTADLTTAQSLYAFLTGRVSTAGGSYFLDEETKEYRQGPAFRREAQNVGGLFVQDQWRLNPQLTMNYGLRWELSGPMMNANDVYSGPTVEDLFGPSTAVFQPGVLNGVADPQIFLRTQPYKGDYVNPAPNVGVAWNPDKPDGFLGKLLGQSVYRANFGINYYDEGLIPFQTANGNGPGLSQTLALPPFTPGSLSLQQPLPPFTRTPTSFTFPIPMSDFTFNRGFSTTDAEVKTPMIVNWTIGYQRELWRDAAIEIRYVGNRGSNLWRFYTINETNVIENGFVQEFRNAQRNLQINQANGRTGFANNGLPGQVPLPIFETAFGPRGSQPALAATAGFNNATFVTQLQNGEAGRLATTLAGGGTNSFQYTCRLVGSNLPGCASRGYDTPGSYPINFFQANPFAAGNFTGSQNTRLLNDEASSEYDALQLQYRQRYRNGLSLTANYTFGKARTDRYTVSAETQQDYRTLRDKSLDWGPTAYDLRHVFQAYGTYELPFGDGRRFDIQNSVLDQILGGWAASTIVRIQTGRPFLLTSGRQTLNQQDAGVILRGITVKQLQDMVKVRPGPNGAVYFFDERLIGPDGRANPEFLTYPTEPGQQGQYVYLYGPGLWNADIGLSKVFRFGNTSTFNFECLLINAFNHRNTTVGNTGGATHSIDSTEFGQSTGVALGARQVQFRLGFNW